MSNNPKTHIIHYGMEWSRMTLLDASTIADTVLRRMSRADRKAIKQRDVHVFWRQGRTTTCAGAFVSQATLYHDRKPTGRVKNGVIEIRVPKHRRHNWLSKAVQITGVMAHEMKHVADARRGLRFACYKRPHDERPHETRAMVFEYDVARALVSDGHLRGRMQKVARRLRGRWTVVKQPSVRKTQTKESK